MQIILMIHGVASSEAEIARLVRKKFFSDKKTFLISFAMPYNFGVLSKKIRRRLPSKMRGNIIDLKFSGLDETRFGGYSSDFGRVLKKLKANIRSGEKVEVGAIGGSATVCFEDINKGAQKEVRRVFGERTVQKTLLPYIYGNAYSESLRLKRSNFRESALKHTKLRKKLMPIRKRL